MGWAGSVAGVLHGLAVDDIHLQKWKGSPDVSGNGQTLTSTTKVGPGWVPGREKDRRSQGGCCNDLMLSHNKKSPSPCGQLIFIVPNKIIHPQQTEKHSTTSGPLPRVI